MVKNFDDFYLLGFVLNKYGCNTDLRNFWLKQFKKVSVKEVCTMYGEVYLEYLVWGFKTD